MPKIYKPILTTSLSIFLAVFSFQSIAQNIISDTNEPSLNAPDKLHPSTPGTPEINKKGQANPNSQSIPDKQIEESSENEENSIQQQVPFSFSSENVNEDAKITQIKIRNFDDLKKAGIKESEIYRMVNEFETYAKNFFFRYEPSDGKIVFLVTLSPLIENGRIIALEKGIKIDNENDLKKFCSKDPTYCSVTSIVSIQNGKVPSMEAFEKGVYNQSTEIYWKNWDYDGKIDFFFEISLRSKP